jgi:dynactin complex subunit
MFIELSHNNNIVYKGSMKQHAYEISKLINDNPDDAYVLKILKPTRVKKKMKLVKEITNVCDIAELCLYNLL